MGKVGNENWTRSWRRVVGAALCVVCWGSVEGEGTVETGGMEKRAKIESGVKWEKEEERRGVGGILTAPSSGTRLNVRDLRPGDLLAARWADEDRNGTPGFWNHLAIVGTGGACVVEAQKSADGVVIAPIKCFLARYSDVCAFRFFDAETARRAAEFAEKWVTIESILTAPLDPRQGSDAEIFAKKDGGGEEGEGNGRAFRENGEKKGGGRGEKTRLSGPRYSWSASLSPLLRDDAKTENCVSLVRRAFWKAAGVDYRWKTPDDLARWDESGDFAKIGRL